MGKNVFVTEIDGWDTWCKIFHSIEVWEPLVNFILEKENLPIAKVEHLAPGSNAVFKSGNYVVKIFTPIESGLDGERDYKTEKYALSFAYSHGVTVPKLVACGKIKDKYDFYYMVMDYIDGVDFNIYSANFSDDEKFAFAKCLREITDAMNKPCEDFNGIDVMRGEGRYNKHWGKYSERFKTERLEYLHTHDFGEKVFVHGDLCYDNFVIDDSGIYIIDFADAVMAPVCYEHAHLICGLFDFDKSYLRGYFGEYNIDELVDICFDGLLIHDFGWDFITWGNRAKVEEIDCLNDLRKKLCELIK
jgi:serine/threonine protein kinase